MKLPAFLAPLLRKSEPVNPGRELARIKHVRERNRIIDRANEMAAAMGRPAIPRRPE